MEILPTEIKNGVGGNEGSIWRYVESEVGESRG